MAKMKMNKADAEKRAFLHIELRANEEQETEESGIIEGYPIVYEKKTDICGYFEEIIARGALKNADLRDVPFLVNHDLNTLPLARSRRNNGNSTMTLTDEESGLKMTAKLDTKNNLRAAELYSAVKRGDINGMSFMFSVEQESWTNEDTDYPTRTIEKIAKVWEVSAVTFPAYKQTSIGARAADEAEAQKILDKIKRSGNGGNEEEETQKQRLQLLIEIEANK